jgi:hypothetical protein
LFAWTGQKTTTLGAVGAFAPPGTEHSTCAEVKTAKFKIPPQRVNWETCNCIMKRDFYFCVKIET